jgi:hypothetical protein
MYIYITIKVCFLQNVSEDQKDKKWKLMAST